MSPPPEAADRSSAVMAIRVSAPVSFPPSGSNPRGFPGRKVCVGDLIQHVAFSTSLLDRFVRMALVIM